MKDEVTDRLCSVTVTVKLTPQEVAWLDRRAGRGLEERGAYYALPKVETERVAYDRYTRVRPSRSSVVRSLVHAAMKASEGTLFDGVEPEKKAKKAKR